MSKNIISSGIIGVLLLIAVFFYLSNYNYYLNLKDKFEVLKVRSQMMNYQKNDFEEKKNTIAKIQGFLDQTKSLGLGKEDWVQYDINIQAPVAFADMENVLNQCATTTAFYFKPISLQIRSLKYMQKVEKSKKSRKTTKTNKAQKSSITTNKAPKKEMDGDVFLNLKGSFVSRKK